jgi:transposase
LHHPPGHAQADFGEATVFIGGVERTAHFFAFDLPHSDASFVRACPAATAEAWVDGHVHAFAFFGRVPQSVLYVRPGRAQAAAPGYRPLSRAAPR